MTTLTKTEAEAILERLTDKTAEEFYRCNRVWDAWNFGTMTREDFEAVEPSILIGDVLEKIRLYLGEMPRTGLPTIEEVHDLNAKLAYLWSFCGLTSSLQEIYNRLEWKLDEYYSETQNQGKCVTEKERDAYRLAKPSPFADLFIYLKEIGL